MAEVEHRRKMEIMETEHKLKMEIMAEDLKRKKELHGLKTDILMLKKRKLLKISPQATGNESTKNGEPTAARLWQPF